ncbi:hypothetical protein CMO90_04155 [Candidatus Woesearchaeota archaeon]|mgnify:CR=1 FL=1|jgi:hypothetical protein|nr:hypothetical protein [Candidatus Woesearchaeota archaeon]|tara:strand:- start:2747 stop:3331 length:585 start_codon:yes stop_codon:yes gene_type:complete
MATFLDISVLGNFSIIFVFLLIFTVIFAFLEFSNPFGKGRKGLHSLIALSIAFLIVISEAAVMMINFMTPWFLVLFLFIFFMLFSVRIFGVSEADTISLIKNPQVYPYLIVFGVIILIASFATTFGQILLEQGTGTEQVDKPTIILPGDVIGGSTQTTSFGENVLNTIVHPKVLGMIAILLVGMFTITFLTKLT